MNVNPTSVLPQYVVFEVDSQDESGEKVLPDTFLSSADFKTKHEFLRAKENLMNFFDERDISFSVKAGNDLEELRTTDLIAYRQFKSIFMGMGGMQEPIA